jgi:threonine synthase
VTAALRRYACTRCGSTWVPDAVRWRCDCGGSFVLDDEGGGRSPAPVSLGEGRTSRVEVVIGGRSVDAKVEFASPTLSFKDRGAAVLVGLAVEVGARRLVVDSSGNAGTAIAAYGARAGLPVEVLVPAGTSAPKVAQAVAHGALVVRVEGTREEAATAAVARVTATGAFYASHVHNPWFWEGTGVFVDELADALPDTLLLPVGNGTLVLGAARALRRRGARCRIIAVQAAACAPIAAAFAAGLDAVAPLARAGPTIAEGIAIAAPPRGTEVLAAIRSSGGRVVTVADEEVVAARAELAAQGLFVEPTAAACAAGVAHLTDHDGTVVLPLCGAGLKAP